MADRPVRRDVLAGDGTWVENRPTKWQQIRNILSPYVTAPINAMERLVNSPAIQYGFAPSEQDVADSFALSGLVTGGSAFAPKPQNAMTMGIRAYHGSPHSFDKFSASKIGTGEGAQVYGHGLYFAENEGIANTYRKNLSYKLLKDKFLQELPADADFADVENLMARGYFSPEETRFLTELRNNDWLGFDYPSQAISAATRGKLKDYDPTPELEGAASNLGHQYEVNINAEPKTFIDYDRPLGEQPDVTSKLGGWQASIANWERSKIGPDPRTLTGGQWLARYSKNPAEMSAALRERGIPGVRYLDQPSRGVGEGTRNYVVFDDKLISIVRKYGIAGASTMLGYNILDNVSKAQAEELRQIEKTGVKK